ncbi:hypothetical protein GCM10010406_12330 [Streptomyces thermolineatus]|uniref:TerD domain-containing protein n=1 Tax=Streptomyces thermolineatus TaxID=44033 RepID=A0ABP5YE29_9ACTN
MAVELVRGQNLPLPGTRLRVAVRAAEPVVVAAVLADATGRARGTDRVAHPGAPALPGVAVPAGAAARHEVAVDLEALPPGTERLAVVLVLPGGRFGAAEAPYASVEDAEGGTVAGFALSGLGEETAVVAVELYRRQGVWKVRAVGQGYAGGFGELLADQGLAPAPQVLRAVADAGRAVGGPVAGAAAAGAAGEHGAVGGAAEALATGSPADESPATGAPAAGPDPGRPTEERLYRQVWGMFEDLARAVAAYRSAVDFAESRMERELERVLDDPAARIGTAAAAAREAARTRCAELVERARAVLDRDVLQLAEEADEVEPALPAALARWDSPAWSAFRAPAEAPRALRLGDLTVPEAPGLRIPMLVGLPLERGLWVDSGRGEEGAGDLAPEEADALALAVAVALVVRLTAAHPAGGPALEVVDPAGTAMPALAPLLAAGVLREPPAPGAAGVSETLERLVRRVDLVQMAVRGGAVDALPPGLDPAGLLLLVHDFPHGFDDRSITRLRYLADEGPAAGVHLLMVADREEAAGHGPLLDPLWRSLLRLTPVPEAHLADPWVGHAWTFHPLLPESGSTVLDRAARASAEARRASGR